jgi:recombination protein RecA
MFAAAQIRAEIEASLARRIPSALTPQPRAIRPTASTGIVAIDDLLGGGLPIGAITEIVGPECSGRTTLALAFLASITGQGKACAWIDVSDALHPESAAAAGVDLDRLLWVRCGNVVAPSNTMPAEIQPVGQIPQTTRVQFGGNSPHPRSESKGMPAAITDMLNTRKKYKRDRITGTPGAPNRPLSNLASAVSTKSDGKEQVATDRLPARRGSYVLEQREAFEPRCAEPQHKPRPQTKNIDAVAIERRYSKAAPSAPARKPWSRLDQALRATDLLLQAGGFSAIVLDMSSIAPEFASRVPLATWFRYRAAAERTQCSFVMLTQYPCAKSSAGAVLRLEEAEPVETGITVFAGLKNHLELSRRRFEQEQSKVVPIRKSPQRESGATWQSRTAWAGGR